MKKVMERLRGDELAEYAFNEEILDRVNALMKQFTLNPYSIEFEVDLDKLFEKDPIEIQVKDQSMCYFGDTILGFADGYGVAFNSLAAVQLTGEMKVLHG